MTDESFSETTDGHPLLDTMRDMVWWMFDDTCVGMGAYRQFDYTLRGDLGSDLSPRLGNCYELAMQAFTGWERMQTRLFSRNEMTLMPAPIGLVHGTWHGPHAPERIAHAWVMLDNGDVWEPITGLICQTTLFHAYTNAEDVVIYNETTARIKMLRNQHYGPWHETDERGV